MFRGFFNRMYYGKGDKPDLMPEDMAQNKFQLFFEVLGVQWWNLVKLNLLIVLFAIPLIVWTGVNIMSVLSILSDAGEALTADSAYQIVSMLFTYIVGLIPCLVILAPRTGRHAGICRSGQGRALWMMADFRDYVRAKDASMGMMPLTVSC
jgi:hypothetical protein